MTLQITVDPQMDELLRMTTCVMMKIKQQTKEILA